MAEVLGIPIEARHEAYMEAEAERLGVESNKKDVFDLLEDQGYE